MKALKLSKNLRLRDKELYDSENKLLLFWMMTPAGQVQSKSKEKKQGLPDGQD